MCPKIDVMEKVKKLEILRQSKQGLTNAVPSASAAQIPNPMSWLHAAGTTRRRTRGHRCTSTVRPACPVLAAIEMWPEAELARCPRWLSLPQRADPAKSMQLRLS